MSLNKRRPPNRNYGKLRLATAGFVALLLGTPSSGQEAVNREIVQPTQSAEVERLNTALLSLARDPQDVSALIAAGNETTLRSVLTS